MIGKKYGFQNKIFGILVLLVSFTAVVLTAVFSRYMKNTSVEVMVERYANRNKELYDAFLNYYDKIDSNMDNFIVNEAVQRSLLNAPLDAVEREKVVRALSFLGDETDYYLYVDNKGILYTQGNVTLDAAQIRESWAALIGETYAETKLVWAEDTLFGGEEMQLFACRYIRPMSQSHEPGILITRMKLDMMSGSFGQFEGTEAAYYILDSQDRICLSLGREEDFQELLEQNMELWDSSAGYSNVISRRNGLISICKDENSDFKVISHVNYADLMSTYYRTLLTGAAVFLLILGCVLYVSLKVSGWLAEPIRRINRHMTEFGDDNMGNYLMLHTNTELDSIGNAYNQMLDRIQELMKTVKFREAELRKSEMDSLMYQINPHFLYNTLDTIYMLARIQQEKEIMQMIQSLTKLLRINLSNGADTILLKDELTYVRAYMDIMKIRNDNLFTYEIECGEELYELPVMKLLLQPLVENGIKHGFKRISEGGSILIQVKEQDGYLCFQVKNNGELMTGQKAEEINRSVKEPLRQEEAVRKEEAVRQKEAVRKEEAVRQKGKGGYGIHNVIRRIRLRYRDRIRFYFAIEENYTVCHIDISMEALRDEK